MRKIKTIQSNNQSIKRFLSPQPPVIQYKKRRKVTRNIDENNCRTQGKNNEPCVISQHPNNADVGDATPERNVDWNSFVSDPGQLCETRYPITLNTFKTMTHCGIVVRRILEDMKTATGLDFLNDEIIKERVLRNYYKQFYEQPQIRERYKLDIKACPTFVKRKIMQTLELMGNENDISKNTERSASLDPDVVRELACTQKEAQLVTKQQNHPTVRTVSQQIAGTQIKSHPNILRISNRTVVNDSEFLLRHIKRHVQDRNKHQTILERIKCEVRYPEKCTQSIETYTKNMPEENATDVEHSVISLSSSSESIVINSVKQRLQQVTDIYFKDYVKTNTLPYLLRMSKGLKRQIITTILKITFEEFSKYTHIYKGAEIYEDLQLLGGYYDYAIKEPQIWPLNLYMTVRDLCEILKSKSIIITTANLKDIPPILLHWEELAALTNFDKIVRWDYYRCKGEKLNKEDTQLMSAYRKTFYEKCWHQNLWLRNVPQFVYMQGMLCIPVMNDQRQSIEAKTNYKQIVSEEKRITEGDDDVNMVAEAIKTSATPTEIESIPNSSTKNAGNTYVSEQTEKVDIDCEMPDVRLEQVSVAVDNDEKSQESVAIIDELPSISSLAISTSVKLVTAIDLIQSDDKSVHDIAVQQRLQNAQDLYFKEVAKSCTLPYLLRFHAGLKRRVIAAIVNMTFTEFQHYTNIYDGAEIYKDTELLQRCYDYTCKEPQVWPINLYIRLADLFQFLETKDVTLTISDLKFVSPKFLHWQDLNSMTNYDYIVYWDYYRNSGDKFYRSNTSIDSYCQTFYAKCWHQDKWIWHTPRILPDVSRDFALSKCAAEADNENIIFERAVITYALRRQHEVKISERIEAAVKDAQTHTVAVGDAEIQTTQDLQEDARQQEIGTSESRSTEAPEHSVRPKAATVDVEIQTSQNLIVPVLNSADAHEPSDMQSSKPCIPLPSRDIKEEKLTPLNKLQFNLTVDDGDNYECVQAPDDVIELDTTLALSQSPQDILLPLSNSENLDANNFNILLPELHDLGTPQNLNGEQARSEQELSELISQVNVNESQARITLEKDSKKDVQTMENLTNVAELTYESQAMSQLKESQTTQRHNSMKDKGIHGEGTLKPMENIVDERKKTKSPEINHTQLQNTARKSNEMQSQLQQNLQPRTATKNILEVAEQPLSKQSQKPLEVEQFIQVKDPLAEMALECQAHAIAQQQQQLRQHHENTSLEDPVSEELALVEHVSEKQETKQELVVTKLQQEKHQKQNLIQHQQHQLIQLHQNQHQHQEQELKLQLKILEKQQQQLQLQIQQYHERELQLQLQQEQFEKLQLQIKQKVKKSQSSPKEQQKQAVQQQQKTAPKDSIQQQKGTAEDSENQERNQKHARAEQKTQTQQQKPKRYAKIKQNLSSNHKQTQKISFKQETPAEQLVRQELPQTGQETTGMEQQELVLEQLVTIAVQESSLIEEQPQQQPRATIEQPIQVYVQQNEQDPRKKEQQIEELIEEITIANNSKELKVVEQPNVQIESTSENLCIDDGANTGLTPTQEQYKTADQQQYSTRVPQQNSTLQTPPIILQRTRTHVHEQLMFGPTITSTQELSRPQARVSKQMRTTSTTTLTKTKTGRAARTTTVTSKRKLGTKNSDYVPQLTHVFPPLPVALNNKKMSPVAQKSAPTTANIITFPSTCNPLSNNPLQINQLVPVINEQKLMPNTTTPNTAVLLTLPATSSMASTNSISTNNLSYVYGLSGDNTFFNNSQLLQIIEPYQLPNKQTGLQQHELQPLHPIQQQQMQLLQQPQEHYENQPSEQTSHETSQQQRQQQQQLQIFQHSSIQQFHQILPPPLVPIQSNNVVQEQQQFLQEEPQRQQGQLLSQCEHQTQEQHQPQYVEQQYVHQLQLALQQQTCEGQQYEQLQVHAPYEQQQHYMQQEHHVQQPQYPVHTTTHQPLVYQILDVTQAPQPQNDRVQQYQQQLEHLQQQTQRKIRIGLENAHITEYKDEVELQEILDSLNSKHLQQAKLQNNSTTTEMLRANIRLEHNYTKSALASSLLNELLDIPKLTSPTKGIAACRMRPNVRLKPFLFRQLEAIDYFNQVTTMNIADYQLQCTSIGQPYLQAKIRTSHGRTLVVIGGDMLKSLLPRCTPRLEQDVSNVLQYLDEFHYNIWEQRQQRKLISKCTHRTLHTLCAQTLLIYFTFSSPFQTQNECLNLKHDLPKFEQPNRWSAAAARTILKPVDSLDNLSMAIEPSILEQMAALRCNF